jgi:hypothetical protein
MQPPPFNIVGQIKISSSPVKEYVPFSTVFFSDFLYIAGLCWLASNCISLTSIEVLYSAGGIFSAFNSHQISEII